MRVVFTTCGSPWDPGAGPAQQTAFALAEAAHRAGVDVTLVCTSDRSRVPVEACAFPVRWAQLLEPGTSRRANIVSPHAAPTAWLLRDLDAVSPIDIVHGQGEEMVLACDAVPRALRVMTAHPVPRAATLQRRPEGMHAVCAPSARLALELAHAVVVSGPGEMNASASVPLLAWESLCAVDRGISRRFFAEASRYADGPATHLLIAGGTGDDPRSVLLLRTLATLAEEERLPVCWLPATGGGRRRAAPSRFSRGLPSVEILRAPEDRDLQRLVGRAAEVFVLDASDAAATVMRVALAMGRRPVAGAESLRSLVVALEELGLPAFPETESELRSQIYAASRRGSPPEPEAEPRAFARAHLSWDAVAARHLALYARLLSGGSGSAAGTPESGKSVSNP